MPDSLPFDSGFSRLLADSPVGEPGPEPFPWQRRLWDSMLGGELPAALDIPTGLGKTAVMAIWLLARASGADLPRRLVYVVDRRVVVDQATTPHIPESRPVCAVRCLVIPAIAA